MQCYPQTSPVSTRSLTHTKLCTNSFEDDIPF